MDFARVGLVLVCPLCAPTRLIPELTRGKFTFLYTRIANVSLWRIFLSFLLFHRPHQASRRHTLNPRTAFCIVFFSHRIVLSARILILLERLHFPFRRRNSFATVFSLALYYWYDYGVQEEV